MATTTPSGRITVPASWITSPSTKTSPNTTRRAGTIPGRTPVANLNYVELRKAKKSLQRLIIGPWIHSAEDIELCRRGAVHRRRGASTSLNVSSALVRPLAQGDRQRCRSRTAGPNLRHGRRRAAQNAGRPAVRRRPLARRTGVAAGPRRRDAVLPAARTEPSRRTSRQ